jgi:hypothetical protein
MWQGMPLATAGPVGTSLMGTEIATVFDNSKPDSVEVWKGEGGEWWMRTHLGRLRLAGCSVVSLPGGGYGVFVVDRR